MVRAGYDRGVKHLENLVHLRLDSLGDFHHNAVHHHRSGPSLLRETTVDVYDRFHRLPLRVSRWELKDVRRRRVTCLTLDVVPDDAQTARDDARPHSPPDQLNDVHDRSVDLLGLPALVRAEMM